jgi:hypothetical protein
MIPKELHKIKKQKKQKNISCGEISILLLFSKVECRPADYHLLETAKKGKNHMTHLFWMQLFS